MVKFELKLTDLTKFIALSIHWHLFCLTLSVCMKIYVMFHINLVKALINKVKNKRKKMYHGNTFVHYSGEGEDWCQNLIIVMIYPNLFKGSIYIIEGLEIQLCTLVWNHSHNKSYSELISYRSIRRQDSICKCRLIRNLGHIINEFLDAKLMFIVPRFLTNLYLITMFLQKVKATDYYFMRQHYAAI